MWNPHAGKTWRMQVMTLQLSSSSSRTVVREGQGVLPPKKGAAVRIRGSSVHFKLLLCPFINRQTFKESLVWARRHRSPRQEHNEP